MRPMRPVWTLHASGDSDASQLTGCHITTNAAGTAYVFTERNINNVMDTAGPPLPNSGTVTFTFNHANIADWTVTAQLPLTPGVSFSGGWSRPGFEDPRPDQTPAQSGTYTAQADGAFEEADKAASSAKA